MEDTGLAGSTKSDRTVLFIYLFRRKYQGCFGGILFINNLTFVNKCVDDLYFC